MAANIPLVGNSMWTTILGSGSFTFANSATSSLIVIGTGTNIFCWTISNGVCPSFLDTVVIIRNQTSSSTINATAYNNYTLNSQVYTSTGTYIQTLGNAMGCDSVIILNLTINMANVGVTQSGDSGENLNAIAIPATYQWIDCTNILR